MENIYAKRVCLLRKRMQEKGIDFYIVPTGDFHQSEYISDYFKSREYLTGFSGSAGTAVVSMEETCLWTDGRYFIQAEQELAGSGIILYKEGMEGVPRISEYIKDHARQGVCIGFDGRVLSAREGMQYQWIAEDCGGTISVEEDLVGELWEERPPFPHSEGFLLEETYAGKSTNAKLQEVREQMKQNRTELHVVSDVCDIAWLLNIRGRDIAHVPVILSHLLIAMDGCTWYVSPQSLNEEIFEYLDKNQVTWKPYEDFYPDLKMINQMPILVDFQRINYQTRCLLGNRIVDKTNPETLLKAVKNSVEIENIRKAHVKDGIAVTKFMYWLKNSIGKEEITEWDTAEYMDRLRAEQEHFVDISFDTIAAYGPNAAMMHYAPTKENCAVLKPQGFLLVDSGGHYLEGSTDITRTFVLGTLTDEERQMYTAVLKGNLALANARFLSGCTGKNLDVLAREPLWKLGKDYRCGTGHGNGYLLNVHEGPNVFRWRSTAAKTEDTAFVPGMVTTDEPGVYEEGRYGIRIENELLCRESVANEYGQFLEFENLTYAPIDLDGICVEDLTDGEKQSLNEYHKMVYDKIAPYLSAEEQAWLKEYTRGV